ncbi:MAG: phage holin family protein [Gemmataceae bacterium]|nr:phage holin family protein [Gemmataceae bacterium]
MNAPNMHIADRGAADVPRSGAAEPGVGELIAGILKDSSKLIENHLALFRTELGNDLRKVKEGIVPLAISVVMAVIAAGLFVTMLVGLLSWAMPSIPWWGWSGILAALFGIAAGILCHSGITKLASFNPMPAETVQTAKESLQCISNQISTDRT